MDWEQAKERLRSCGHADGGWPHVLNGAPRSETTALVGLAALAVGDADWAAAAGAWLARRQQPDGSVGVDAKLPQPAWTTSHALLLWSYLPDLDSPRRQAVDFLLQDQGKAIAKGPNDPVLHDTTLVGWSWAPNTHSWLEPTALAVLALSRMGLADHPRVVEGRKLIIDRAIRTGGWNYGNSGAFGADLRPRPAPTGLALLALAGSAGDEPECVGRALAYLEGLLPTIRASQSLCWGLAGMTVWQRRPAATAAWLDEALQTSVAHPRDLPTALAYLFIAHRSEWATTLVRSGDKT